LALSIEAACNWLNKLEAENAPAVSETCCKNRRRLFIQDGLKKKDKTFCSLFGYIFAVKSAAMKNKFFVLYLVLFFWVAASSTADAQCSICTKTASQLDEKPAKGMNSGILYLMFAPLGIAGYIGFRWWKREQLFLEGEK